MILHADSLICQARHKGAVCGLTGAKVHEISQGVSCKVGGIRYAPISTPMACLDADGLQSESPQAIEVAFNSSAAQL
jgi:hypothetical protein